MNTISLGYGGLNEKISELWIRAYAAHLNQIGPAWTLTLVADECAKCADLAVEEFKKRFSV